MTRPSARRHPNTPENGPHEKPTYTKGSSPPGRSQLHNHHLVNFELNHFHNIICIYMSTPSHLPKFSLQTQPLCRPTINRDDLSVNPLPFLARHEDDDARNVGGETVAVQRGGESRHLFGGSALALHPLEKEERQRHVYMCMRIIHTSLPGIQDQRDGWKQKGEHTCCLSSAEYFAPSGM